MTLPIHWGQQARADLLAIVCYISEHDPTAARRLRDSILDAVSTTGDHPYLYKPGRIAGTREIVAHPNYIVVYKVGQRIEVLSVLHSRQRYPQGGDDS